VALAIAASAVLGACSGSSEKATAPAATVGFAAPATVAPQRPLAAMGDWSRTEITYSPVPRAVARSAPAPYSRPPKTAGVFKIGKPYEVNGQVYLPGHDPGYDRRGLASWYGHAFHGRKTANGEFFDMNALTAAHKTLPLPSYAYVTNLQNSRTILVRINDRGPYKPNRIIDLSRAAARALAFEGLGLAEVRVRYAGRAPLLPDDTRERRFLAAQACSRRPLPPYSLGLSAALFPGE
jgi:rare lipoprotein A